MDSFSLLIWLLHFSTNLVLTEWLLRQPFPDGSKRKWWDGHCFPEVCREKDFLIIFLLKVVTGMKKKILTFQDWKVGVRRESTVKSICMILIFRESRGTPCFVLIHIIIHSIEGFAALWHHHKAISRKDLVFSLFSIRARDSLFPLCPVSHQELDEVLNLLYLHPWWYLRWKP